MVCAHIFVISFKLILEKHKVQHLKQTKNKVSFPNTTPQGTSYSVYGEILPGSTSAIYTLVFIHGVGLNKLVWAPQICYFSSHYRIVVYDLLGHGSSPLPPKKVTLEHYSAQLAELLDHLKIASANFVGHSMGAIISVAFALEFPNRVESLVPMNIVYKRDALQKKSVMVRAEQVLKNQQISGINETLHRWFSAKTDVQSLKKIEQIRKWLSQIEPTGYGRTYRLFAESDNAFEGRLQQLNLPVLYLTGQDDANSTPEMSRLMAAESANANTMVIDNEAHMMAYISPDTINPIIIDFLRNLRRSYE